MTKRKFFCLSLAAPLLIAGYIGSATSAVLYANPADLAPGDPVGTFFPGLSFSTVPADGTYIGTTVITQMTQTGQALGPVFSTGSAFDYFGGFSLLDGFTKRAMRVDFASPVSFVSVDFRPDDNDTGLLQAYSADNTLLSELIDRDSQAFVLSFSSSNTPISYILATYADTGKIGRVGFEASAVPAPATHALMLAGFSLLFIRRFRQKTGDRHQARGDHLV